MDPAIQPPMNRKTKYYYAHRDDPAFQQRMKEAKQRYYQKNRESVIQKTLARYYEKKALQPPAWNQASPFIQEWNLRHKMATSSFPKTGLKPK